MVQFLHPKGPSTTFHLTNRDNINFITFEDIHGQITVPKPQTCSLRKYIIESNALKLINKIGYTLFHQVKNSLFYYNIYL